MAPVSAAHRWTRLARVALGAGLAIVTCLCLAPSAAAQSTPGSLGRLGVRVISPPASRTLVGSVYALDRAGQPVDNFTSDPLVVKVDGTPARLLLGDRPSIALAVGFWLDSSASPEVRDALANALADGLVDIDVDRDSVAIASTTDSTSWNQASFTSSATDLQASLNGVIQGAPLDGQASLQQVSNVLGSLGGQSADTRVLLLFTNRPLAADVSVDASLAGLRTYAVDNGIQIGIVALPGTGGRGLAEALAERTPGGRVEYVVNPADRRDIGRRVGLVLAPAFGAHRIEMPAPRLGSHTLSVGLAGTPLEATTGFQVAARPVDIASIDMTARPLEIALLLVGELLVVVLLLRIGPTDRGRSAVTQEFSPSLRLNPLARHRVAPDVIEFPTRGRLRIGYHPPLMDDHVASRQFARLAYQDIRGDDATLEDLSCHAACIWRDPRTNECYIQLGWSGSGHPVGAQPQTQVFRFGRPQEATLRPFRLAHHDVVRLSNGVEFVFNQVGLRDQATPETQKVSALEPRPAGGGRIAVLSDVRRRPRHI